jgi:hypothetical protein
MENKFSYRAKLTLLESMSTKVTEMRSLLVQLSALEGLAADPDVSEFFPLGTALDDLDAALEPLLIDVEGLAFFEKK